MQKLKKRWETVIKFRNIVHEREMFLFSNELMNDSASTRLDLSDILRIYELLKC